MALPVFPYECGSQPHGVTSTSTWVRLVVTVAFHHFHPPYQDSEAPCPRRPTGVIGQYVPMDSAFRRVGSTCTWDGSVGRAAFLTDRRGGQAATWLCRAGR